MPIGAFFCARRMVTAFDAAGGPRENNFGHVLEPRSVRQPLNGRLVLLRKPERMKRARVRLTLPVSARNYL